ncbi:hypothetical protein GCM10011344_30240 [Dokdonia pacifica]|uniref:DUF5777 domain-containing protein n=1 Tax=Dokdonia pacifica TaxID=1627892 RepID=A0A239BY24_9FLAO|nr:DUF5777 family beta-barrel protein [Dokdonia pacifica]GGG27373.1 hypothetical protein GCM10011344_30240 [Dokdonia pacifica]SNS12790.1 hypothetical protein SAMN06265376_10717 [Dokdonia pacifica]
MKKLVFLLLLLPIVAIAQDDDLLNELEQEVPDEQQPVTSVFKGIKIVNFESTKLVGEKQLQFIISHRFGDLSDGIDNFIGLDDATARIQFVYGVTDWLNVGISRSGFNKTYDAAVKYRFLRQTEGKSPVTLVGYHLFNINTELDSDLLPELTFSDRLGYAHQLLVSRKFNDWLSLQLIPTYFHDNTVREDGQDNSQFALGIGGRFKFTKRLAFIGDYGIHLNRVSGSDFNNSLALGIEIETGGHVFQLHVSNARAIFANGFLGQARGDFGDGNVFLGFNISRAFSLGSKK